MSAALLCAALPCRPAQFAPRAARGTVGSTTVRQQSFTIGRCDRVQMRTMGSADAQVRLDLMSRVAALLAESADCERALEEMAHAIVTAPNVADFCALDLVDEPGLP